MRRFVYPSHIAAFVAFVAVVMLTASVLKDWVTHPTVQEVRADVRKGPTVDPAEAKTLIVGTHHLPDWSRWSWKLTGARTDTLEDATDAITGYYERGNRTIAVTIAGVPAGGLNDGEITRSVQRTPAYGKTALVLGGDSGGAKPSQVVFEDDGLTLSSGLECTDGCRSRPAGRVLSVKRGLGDDTLLLTGWPFTDEHFAEMQDMALRVQP